MASDCRVVKVSSLSDSYVKNGSKRFFGSEVLGYIFKIKLKGLYG